MSKKENQVQKPNEKFKLSIPGKPNVPYTMHNGLRVPTTRASTLLLCPHAETVYSCKCPVKGCTKTLKATSGVVEHMRCKHGRDPTNADLEIMKVQKKKDNLQKREDDMKAQKKKESDRLAQQKRQAAINEKVKYLNEFIAARKFARDAASRMQFLKAKYPNSTVSKLVDDDEPNIRSSSTLMVYITDINDAHSAINAIYEELEAQSDYMRVHKNYMKKHPKIALDLQGKFLSATGPVSVLSMCTGVRIAPIYLFDVKVIGPQLFAEFKHFDLGDRIAGATEEDVGDKMSIDDNDSENNDDDGHEKHVYDIYIDKDNKQNSNSTDKNNSSSSCLSSKSNSSSMGIFASDSDAVINVATSNFNGVTILNRFFRPTTRSLKHLLEDTSIIKLMFDVRADAAALSKQFNVNLRGLYDVQIMFAYRFQAPDDKFLRGLRKVVEVFEEHTATPYDSLYRKCGNSFDDLDKTINVNDMPDKSTRAAFHNKWDVRPLPVQNLEYAACDVMHLVEFYHDWGTAKGEQINYKLEQVLELSIPELSAKRAEKATSNLGFGAFGQGVKNGAHMDFELPPGRRSCRPGTGQVATGKKGFGKGPNNGIPSEQERNRQTAELLRRQGIGIGGCDIFGGCDSDDDFGGYGIFGDSDDDREALWCQGVKECDADAGDVLDALRDF